MLGSSTRVCDFVLVTSFEKSFRYSLALLVELDEGFVLFFFATILSAANENVGGWSLSHMHPTARSVDTALSPNRFLSEYSAAVAKSRQFANHQ